MALNDAFFNQLFLQQQQKEAVPSNKDITGWVKRLIRLLYPQLSTCVLCSEKAVREVFHELEAELVNILNTTTVCRDCDKEEVTRRFFDAVPEVYRLLNTDIEALLTGDPAAHSSFEVIRAYPGFYALCFYRIAHALHQLDVPLVPRILTEHAHSQTGIDIHPAAQIGEYFCIDHGTGVVIGETTKIGRHVKIYQGVTLGALSVKKEMAFTKRHPTVEDHVVIYAGATILGGETVIGHHSVIGGNVWVTESIPAGSLVYHRLETTIVEGKYLKAAT
ncbi:MAG TPA: serine O-acetyltransferase EpsC [Flavisolibacter sp.]|nr:serine O-acetyltransferase EpsC [Flavisolibacter sp.]